MSEVDLAGLLPHADPMLLLAAIEHWDAVEIMARGRDCRRRGHPLAHDGELGAVALMEYGAQAAGAHAALVAGDGGGRDAPAGVVAGMRHIRGLATSLPSSVPPLPVVARRLAGGASGFVYEASIRIDACNWVTGEITIASTGRK